MTNSSYLEIIKNLVGMAYEFKLQLHKQDIIAEDKYTG